MPVQRVRQVLHLVPYPLVGEHLILAVMGAPLQGQFFLYFLALYNKQNMCLRCAFFHVAVYCDISHLFTQTCRPASHFCRVLLFLMAP